MISLVQSPHVPPFNLYKVFVTTMSADCYEPKVTLRLTSWKAMMKPLLAFATSHGSSVLLLPFRKCPVCGFILSVVVNDPNRSGPTHTHSAANPINPVRRGTEVVMIVMASHHGSVRRMVMLLLNVAFAGLIVIEYKRLKSFAVLHDKKLGASPLGTVACRPRNQLMFANMH